MRFLLSLDLIISALSSATVGLISACKETVKFKGEKERTKASKLLGHWKENVGGILTTYEKSCGLVDIPPDCGSHGLRFESQRSTNVL